MGSNFLYTQETHFQTGLALTLAKREYLAEQRKINSEFANPYFWSGYVMIGDWRGDP